MTPADLLAACREAWPEHPPEGLWRVSMPEPWCYVVRDLPTGLQACAARNALGVSVSLLGGDDGESMVDFDAPATPSGVREVVGKLRAWVRAEARRLAEEVDPPRAPEACGAERFGAVCTLPSDHQGSHLGKLDGATVGWF